jgi:hypothetical protein
MPFTPFHLGPGALFKAAGGAHFSFMIFGGSQVLMDLEPLARMIRGDSVLHGPSHTIIGAFGIGVISAVMGRPASEYALRLMGIGHSPLTWSVALASAFIGTYSHIGLDAIMHRDLRPFWPFALTNPLLDAISIPQLHMLCIACGVVGGAIVALKAKLR